MELRENSVLEWVKNKTLNVLHVSERVNPADIFTKEMRDGAHFRRLWDSFVCRLSNFHQQSLLVIHHQSQSTSHKTPRQVVPSAASPKATFVILRLGVPFPYAGPSQPFIICRVRVVSLYDTFITLFRQVCSEIRYGKNGSFSAHCSWTQGWGVLFHVYLEGIFDIPCGMPRRRATWSFLGPLA